MTTIDGENIYLHSVMDGQTVLATTSATFGAGEVVAAIYLEPSADLLSAEVTMVTFKAIDHPDGTDHEMSMLMEMSMSLVGSSAPQKDPPPK